MYNGIGLSTPRGSGTSGYVTANKAIVSKQKSRLDFIKEMKALRTNILPPPRQANKDILDHNQKR
jgi:serine/arginine repetitive matrix protein 2